MEREYEIEYLGAGPGMEYHIFVDVSQDMPIHSFEGLLNLHFGREKWKDGDRIHVALRRSGKVRNIIYNLLVNMGVI